MFVSGFCYPSHGLYHVDAGGQRRVSADVRATIFPDGRRFIEADAGRVTLRDSYRASDDAFEPRHILARVPVPALGMAKYGRAIPTSDDAAIVLTDAYTIAHVRFGG